MEPRDEDDFALKMMRGVLVLFNDWIHDRAKVSPGEVPRETFLQMFLDDLKEEAKPIEATTPQITTITTPDNVRAFKRTS